MKRPIEPRIASPTIGEVLAEFLAEQEKRLSRKTLAQHRSVVELLEHSLNGYAYQSLDEADAQLFHELYDAEGDEHREFCDIFGPEHILSNVGEFLNYFMVRKVIAGKGLMGAAGTVTKKLARWLEQKGYADPEAAAEATERGAAAARDLPQAEELASDLADFAEGQERGDEEQEIEDHFRITKIEPGKIWFDAFLDGGELGPVSIPVKLSRRCKVGWTISGVLGRVRGKWTLVEAWNVYPA